MSSPHSAPSPGPETVALHHVVEGPPGAPALLLAPSLGTTLAMWDDLVPALVERYRVVRFDTRGHGGSPVPPGPYSLPALAQDVVALADRLGLDRFAFLGISLGGLVGQVLAATYPQRVSALVLCCTSPAFGDPATWRERSDRVRAEGMGWLVEPTRARWFTRGLLEAHPQRARSLLDMLAATNPEGYASCCDAIAGFDATGMLGSIVAPTRVVAGAEDPVSPPETAQRLADAINGADLVVLADASHIANVAQPEHFRAAVLEHLDRNG